MHLSFIYYRLLIYFVRTNYPVQKSYSVLVRDKNELSLSFDYHIRAFPRSWQHGCIFLSILLEKGHFVCLQP